jgi:phasin family protein
MIKSFEEFQAFGKEGLEAYVNSATAMTKGMQNIASEAVDFSRKSFEQNAAVFEKVLAAKSIDKALEVQQGYAKDAFEAYMGQINKFGELYANVAKEAYKPFETKINQFAGKAAGK